MTFRVCMKKPDGYESKGASMKESQREEYKRHCEEQELRYPGWHWWLESCGEGLRHQVISTPHSAAEKHK